MILSQGSSDPTFRFFDDIISGQLDCDKMDYLLRDSHYCGVEYGVFDLDKLIHSLRVAKLEGNYVLAINDSEISPIQDFSFTLRSISDRKISILRVYADGSMAEEIREKTRELEITATTFYIDRQQNSHRNQCFANIAFSMGMFLYLFFSS